MGCGASTPEGAAAAPGSKATAPVKAGTKAAAPAKGAKAAAGTTVVGQPWTPDYQPESIMPPTRGRGGCYVLNPTDPHVICSARDGGVNTIN
jgi:hypothetical protein